MAATLDEFCKNVQFWAFQALRSLVSRGKRGTLRHSNMLDKVSKVVLSGRHNTFT